ncbi:GTP-binding protein [Nesterenkonia sp. AY15]|uniref:GTP-binding protein n=1 Tax=Nesterenkonia sp. AY15 TaxID=2901139 RepID=UPI00406D0559
MRLTILSSLDALCRQRACDMLSSAYPTATLMLHDLMEDNVLGRRTVGPDSSVQRAETVLEHPCPSCAVRLEIAPAIQNAREHGVEHLILALPPTLPAAALVQALADLPRRSVMLNAVVLACAPGSVEDQVWDPHTLFESGYLVLPQDERTPGEFLMEELAFTETVLLADPELVPITPFERARGVQLVQELAPHARITDRGTDIEARTQHLKNRAGHSPRNGLNRAPSTPDSAFTTVVHHLHRPLHPQRFRHALHSLAPGCARLRGELWMAPVPECRILLRGAGPRIWLKNVGPWASIL